jgi:hypothetical protein|tara:strand:- start:2029 stop:2616 length:588 start_codon:yes stop_codon:yes gene_type:complete
MRVKKKTALIFFLIAFSLVVYLLYASIAKAETIVTDSTTDSEVRSKIDSTTTVKSPPPSAISPSINASNSDLCTVGVSGAVQTQILGISAGKTVRDMNCEKLKNAKTLYDMGMKVGAVAVMCGDERIFKAMMNAGTPCPFDGLVGLPAKEAWNNNQHLIPGHVPGKKEDWNDDDKATAKGAGAIGGLLLALLFFL